MSAKKLRVGIIILALAGFVFLPAVFVFWPFWTKLQTLDSPDDLHTAELFRIDGIDRNYIIRVDGVSVYRSPDFAPNQRIPFRETLAWDKSGHIALLEIARQRIFGYDAETRCALSEDELLALELSPEPPLWEYYFESEWPGVGRAHRPERGSEVNSK